MNGYVIAAIFAMAAVTFPVRAAPFLFLERFARHRAVRYVGRGTPPVILTLLVLYCLKGVSVLVPPHGLPEAIALIVTIGLHLSFRNALVSIGAGTGAYMVLVQTGILQTLF
ncbi:MAG: AzlD domain-containing protein [Rhodospirillales bacterium]|nr:AzlD domain-containing protein [Rhodospirillales bacterium]